ncbi:MAG: hypothetical protein VB110_07285 [Bacteroidales bacterium]|nr:hypothetical protein [Bacteroidales bacterium]
MKKTLLLLFLTFLITGCEKETEPVLEKEPVALVVKELEIRQFVSLIDSSVEQIRSTFKNEQLDESSILGKTRSINFTKVTEESSYQIYFDFNSEEKVTDISIYSDYFSYSGGLSFTKKLSDRFVVIYPQAPYEGYSIPKGYNKFNKQVEFWDFVRDNCVENYSYTHEGWIIGNIYLDLWFYLNNKSSASIFITNDNSLL